MSERGEHDEHRPAAGDDARPGVYDQGDAARAERAAARDARASRSTVLHDDDGYDEFFEFEGGDARDFVRIPHRAPQVPRFFSWGLAVKLLVLVALILGGVWAYHQVNPSGDPGDPVLVEVPEGASMGVIADVLDDAGVISSSRLFQEYARFKSDGLIAAGSYEMQKDMALWEALDALEAGPSPIGYTNVTLPEGLRLSSALATISATVPRLTPELLDAALASGQVVSKYQAPGASLEGFLFPETYRVEDSMTAEQALAQMTAEFDRTADELGLENRGAALGYTPAQIITIASMIEEEARIPEERAKIARVIYNRIGNGMRLDIDATTLYAVGKEGEALTVTDLDSDSPYNTRKASGLPPGPISAPGRASIEAALSPADGPWLYYVLADADGNHAFTDSPDEFETLVAEADAKGLLG